MKSTIIVFTIFIFLVLTSCASTHAETKPELSTDYIQSWVGLYRFNEIVESPIGSNLTIIYQIYIYEEDGEYYANIIIDGNLTMVRNRAFVKGNGESIDLVFNSFLPDSPNVNLNIEIEIGILLTFTRQGSEIVTTWGVIQPALEANKKPGVHFELIENE